MTYQKNRARLRRAGWAGRSKGIAYVLALCLVTALAVMGIAFASVTGLELRKAQNFHWQQDAQFAAESGLAYMTHQLSVVRLPASTTQATIVSGLSGVLGNIMNGTVTMGEAVVTNSGSMVYVPPVSLGDDRTFQAWIMPLGDRRCLLVCSGTAGQSHRTVSVEVELVPALARAFDYWVASRGSIIVSGSTNITGVNHPLEGSIFSDMGSAGSITLSGGGVSVSGNLLVSGGRECVTIVGTPSVGGTKDPAEIENRICKNVASPDFPELDLAPLVALATNLVDASTNTSGTLNFSNIRIAAGTNPTFAAGTVINGVIYVEAPNQVMFAGHVTIKGFIVTQDSDEGVNSCTIDFNGTVDATGVDALPDTPEYAAVKQQTGSFLLAPGFKVSFGGNFETINGSIAADQIHFSGNSEGVIKGAVIGLSELPATFEGSVEINVDRSEIHQDPAGFVKSLAPEADYGSYGEPVN